MGNERTSWESAEERAGAGVRRTEVIRGMGDSCWDLTEPRDKENVVRHSRIGETFKPRREIIDQSSY